MNRITAWVAALISVLACPAFGEMLEGHVIHVADGDTITVLKGKEQLRVRIGGIDAPERRQAFSRHNGSSVQHGPPADCDRRVAQERPLRPAGGIGVLEGSGHRAGLAWHYKRYANEQTSDKRERYAETEQKARAHRIGLWQDKEPVPPWEWRQETKRAGHLTFEPGPMRLLKTRT
jgi:hypothetical protein